MYESNIHLPIHEYRSVRRTSRACRTHSRFRAISRKTQTGRLCLPEVDWESDLRNVLSTVRHACHHRPSSRPFFTLIPSISSPRGKGATQDSRSHSFKEDFFSNLRPLDGFEPRQQRGLSSFATDS